MNGRYRTIRKNGESEIEIKKSRFICSLKRVAEEEEALSFIREIKREHPKATHNCSAYLIGEQ
ncbi:MAG: YigZ family protein, partial [Pisciglobus halotolerans]|nr:YigZ family protein [Pisciglobus halotolerans]